MLRRSNLKFSSSPAAAASSAVSRKADVCIIGGGVAGAASALELARTGRYNKILIVDKNKNCGSGTTSFSSGIIRTFYSEPNAVKISAECLHVWKNWSDYLQLSSSGRENQDLAKFRSCPLWCLRTDEMEGLLGTFIPAAKANNIQVNLLDYAETKKIADKIGWNLKCFCPEANRSAGCFSSSSSSSSSSSDSDSDSARRQQQEEEEENFGKLKKGKTEQDEISSSVLVPDTGYVSDPRLAVENLCSAAKQTGKVEFVLGHKVTDALFSSSSSSSLQGVVLEDGSEISSPIVINAAGPFSNSVRNLFLSHLEQQDLDNNNNNNNEKKKKLLVRCRALRAECVSISAPEGVDFSRDGVISFDLSLNTYLRPEPFGNKVLVGGLDLEEADRLDWLSEQELEEFERNDSANGRLSRQAEGHLMRYALRSPGVRFNPSKLRGIVSMYDATPDWSPIVDQVFSSEENNNNKGKGYYEVSGTSGNCFKVAPLLGKMIAAKLNGENNIKLDHLNSEFGFDCYSVRRSGMQVIGGVIG